MHGPYGEDGRIQGLLEYLKIPYSGSGVLPSAIGIDKSVQKKLMVNAGFNSPKYLTIDRTDWIRAKSTTSLKKVRELIGFPCVVKPANQGSSIGITVLNYIDDFEFMSAVEKAFFTKWLDSSAWKKLSDTEKIEFRRFPFRWFWWNMEHESKQAILT